MRAMAFQITGVSIVYWNVCSGADQIKYQRSVSLAYVGNSPVIGEFPAHWANNAENISIWWHHGWVFSHILVRQMDIFSVSEWILFLLTDFDQVLYRPPYMLLLIWFHALVRNFENIILGWKTPYIWHHQNYILYMNCYAHLAVIWCQYIILIFLFSYLLLNSSKVRGMHISKSNAIIQPRRCRKWSGSAV